MEKANQNLRRLTNSETEVMKLLWNTEKPLSVQSLYNQMGYSGAISAIHVYVKRLENDGFIEMVGVDTNRNYARIFSPILKLEEYYTFILSKMTKNQERDVTRVVLYWMKNGYITRETIKEIIDIIPNNTY